MVVPEPSPPELLLLFAAFELGAKNVISRLAAGKAIRKEFLRFIGPLGAPRAGELKVLVLCYLSSAQALRPCRHAQLLRHHLNEPGGAGFWSPSTTCAPIVCRPIQPGHTTSR